jgi:short-subunit dehydrogenase
MATETVLITGASSGIGLELAKLFAADKSTLVLVARRADRLRQLAEELQAAHGTAVRVLPHDLADPEAPQALFKELRNAGVSVDVLVNNAGFGARGPLATLDTQRQLDMLQVNVEALTHLTRLFLPGMLERRRGAILNVGSVAGFLPGPNTAIYYATKAYVLSLTEALAAELAGTGVRMTLLAPGATATEFATAAGYPGPRRDAMDPAKVARAGYEGLRAGKVLVVPGFKNRAAVLAVRLLPRAVVRKAMQMRT